MEEYDVVVWQRRGLIMVPVMWTEPIERDRPNHRRLGTEALLSPVGEGEFFGVPQIAAQLGVTEQAVRNWRSNRRDPNHPTPEPDGTKGHGKFQWRADRLQEWRAWHAEHLKRIARSTGRMYVKKPQ